MCNLLTNSHLYGDLGSASCWCYFLCDWMIYLDPDCNLLTTSP